MNESNILRLKNLIRPYRLSQKKIIIKSVQKRYFVLINFDNEKAYHVVNEDK